MQKRTMIKTLKINPPLLAQKKGDCFGVIYAGDADV